MTSQQHFTTATGSLYFQHNLNIDLLSEWSRSDAIVIAALDVQGWNKLQLTSPAPLLGEVIPLAGPYEYTYYFRRGAKGHFLLVSTHSDLVDILINKLDAHLQAFKPTIDVQKIVTDLAAKPAKYTMSIVYARIEGYGQSLKSIAFYGNDLGEASLFRSLLTQLTPHRVMLRDIVKRTDVLSVGARGEVAFPFAGSDSFLDVDRALRFLAQGGYLNWNANE